MENRSYCCALIGEQLDVQQLTKKRMDVPFVHSGTICLLIYVVVYCSYLCSCFLGGGGGGLRNASMLTVTTAAG